MTILNKTMAVLIHEDIILRPTWSTDTWRLINIWYIGGGEKIGERRKEGERIHENKNYIGVYMGN